MTKAEMWAAHFQRREELRVSVGEYCEREGLRRNQWWYWHHKLKGPAEKKAGKLSPVRSSSASLFVAAQLSSESPTPACEFLYPSGVRIRCSGFPPMAWVREIV